MRKILILTLNTFREAVRDKILYTLIFFAILFSFASILMATISLGENKRMLINMGLANIEIFGTLIAIFVGISLVYKELQRRTIYTIVTRPIFRYQFLLGKYFGLLLTLAVQILLMLAVVVFNLAIFGGLERIPDVLKALWLIYLELALITAVATLFSAYSTPILSGMFTLAFYLIGSTSYYLSWLLDGSTDRVTGQIPESIQWLIKGLQVILPDFSLLNIKAQVAHQIEIPWDYMLHSSLYGISYSVVVLVLAIFIFSRRDLK